MSFYDDKPLRTWKIVWRTGRVERIRGHQISWPNALRCDEPCRVHIHGEIDGTWTLVLSADEADISYMHEVGRRDWLAWLRIPRVFSWTGSARDQEPAR